APAFEHRPVELIAQFLCQPPQIQADILADLLLGDEAGHRAQEERQRQRDAADQQRDLAAQAVARVQRCKQALDAVGIRLSASAYGHSFVASDSVNWSIAMTWR